LGTVGCDPAHGAPAKHTKTVVVRKRRLSGDESDSICW